MKRLTALILAILMLVQLCPSVSFAADNSSDSQHEVLSEQLGKPVYHTVTFLADGEEVSAVFVADGTAIDELPAAHARSRRGNAVGRSPGPSLWNGRRGAKSDCAVAAT